MTIHIYRSVGYVVLESNDDFIFISFWWSLC